MATKEPNRLSFDFKDHPGLCDRLRQKCLEENLPMTKIVAQLIERWLNEGIDPPQTVDDKICPKIYGLFKEHCPNFSIPDFNQDLVEQIKMSLARTHQKEEWYVNLFKKAASIPWAGWQPDFEWLLKFENSLKILDGNIGLVTPYGTTITEVLLPRQIFSAIARSFSPSLVSFTVPQWIISIVRSRCAKASIACPIPWVSLAACPLFPRHFTSIPIEPWIGCLTTMSRRLLLPSMFTSGPQSSRQNAFQAASERPMRCV